MGYIYVLRLRDDKYYIGHVDDPTFDITLRTSKEAMIKKYKWLKLYDTNTWNFIEIKRDSDKIQQNILTIQYMAQYGIDNVRGGCFSSVVLDDSDKNTLQKMLGISA